MTEPCAQIERLVEIEHEQHDVRLASAETCGQLLALEGRIKTLEAAAGARDPVSPRMLALVMVVGVVAAAVALGWGKILPGEAIAGLIGALVGRLTSDIGSEGKQAKT